MIHDTPITYINITNLHNITQKVDFLVSTEEYNR